MIDFSNLNKADIVNYIQGKFKIQIGYNTIPADKDASWSDCVLPNGLIINARKSWFDKHSLSIWASECDGYIYARHDIIPMHTYCYTTEDVDNIVNRIISYQG